MPEMKKTLSMAGLAVVACAFLFLPSILRAQGRPANTRTCPPRRLGTSGSGPEIPISSCWTFGPRRSSERRGSKAP